MCVTSIPGQQQRGDERQYELAEPYPDYTNERQLWFKAAVIAVPIAGGFILLLLVLLAVRMLRHDKERHNRLLQLRTHRSLVKAHLYVTDHFTEKQHKPCDIHHSVNNAYRDKVKVHSERGYGKLPPSKTTSSPAKDAILVWGQTAASMEASVV